MPQIRCMHFDEHGNPRGAGCRSQNCDFIHPGNPAWERALISRNTPRERGSGRAGTFGGRGRGRGSNSSHSSSTSFASGWVTGGSVNAANTQNSGWEMGNAKDSAISSDNVWGSASGWGSTDSGWGAGGWDDPATGSKESSGGGWDAFAGSWGSGRWDDAATGSKETSGDGWGASGDGWGTSGDGWGTSGEVTQPPQEKRDDKEKDKLKSPIVPPPRPAWRASSGWKDDKQDAMTKSLPIQTATNRIPVINTRWGRKEDTTASPNLAPVEKPCVSPLQMSASGNSTAGQSSALLSSEEGHTDVDKWLQKEKALKPHNKSPSVSTVTVAASTASRKRKFGSSELEKQQDNWRDFIRVFDRAIRAKAAFDKAEAERQSWVRTQKSTTYERIGEAGRNRLDGHRAALESARKTHSDKLTRAITELAEAGETLKSSVDYDQRYDIEDQVTRYLKEIGAWLEDIRPLLIAHTSQHPSNSDGPTSQEDDDNPPQETCTNPDGLDPLRSRLDNQEELLEELRTAVTLGSSKNALSTIASRIDKKIDALREARADAKANVPPPKVVIPSEATGAIEEVSRKTSELTTAMEKPVNDVAHLLIHQDEMQKAHISFKIENEELRQSMANLTEMTAANRGLIQAQTETIQRLKASLKAFSESRRTPPPADPAIKVMFQDLRAAVDEVVQGILSREVVPVVAQLSEECRSENQRIHREVFETIWDRVDPALKLTDAVNRWVSKFDLPAS